MIKRLGKDKYLVRVSLGTVAGKVKLHNRTIYGPRSDAEAYERDIITKRKQGLPITPTRLTVAAFHEDWLNRRLAREKIRPNTAEYYGGNLRRYVESRCGSVRLSELRPFHVEDVIESMTNAGLSPNTVRLTLTIWHAALQRAVRWGLLHTNPIRAVEMPAKQKPEVRAFSRDEARKFMEAAATDEFLPVYYLVLYSGMRPEEVAGLKWSCLDLDAGMVKVREVVIWLKGRWEFAKPKTKTSVRDIPIPLVVVRVLREHKRRQSEEIMKVRRFYRDDLDLVFANSLGLPLRHESITAYHVKPIAEAAGLGRAGLYTLRHTFATLLLEAGENVKVVSALLGHASVIITMDVYQHLLPTMSEGASRKLEKLLKI